MAAIPNLRRKAQLRLDDMKREPILVLRLIVIVA